MSWSKIFHSVSEKYHALSIAQNRGQKKNSREKCFPYLIYVAWLNLLWVLAKIRSKGKATKYNSERPHLGETDDIFLKTQIQELCPTEQQKVWVGYLQKSWV